MRIGVVKEIKDSESRVALTPGGAGQLADAGHRVYVEAGAGAACGFSDSDYAAAGAELVGRDDAWSAELVLKVKEPLEEEYGFLNGQILFTYLHLAGGSRALTSDLLESGTTAVAYETVEDAAGRLPLLAPMSAVAGSMAPIVGAYHLARYKGGRGTLLGRVLGEGYGKAMILGDGIVGQHTAQVVAAMGAETVVFGLDAARGEALKREISKSLIFEISTAETIARHLRDVDLLVGAVLVRGARAPHLISEELVQTMPEGSVIVDVSIDQGGCIETSRPTTHSNPTFVKHGIVHYCVTNMPGAYPRTSTMALTRATLPYIQRIADIGVDVFRGDSGFAAGVNTFQGHLTCEAVADGFGWKSRYRPLAEAMSKET
jgi:alanine dehydrogenase